MILSESIMQNEIWKDIPGYEGWYQISNIGRIRSVDRYITQMSRHGHNVDRLMKGKIIKPMDNGNGYLIVGLRKNQVRKNVYIHRIVAELFVDGYVDGLVVNHIDYDKTNNSVNNLEWVTQLENVHHSIQNYCHEKNVFNKSLTGEKYIGKRGSKFRCHIKVRGIKMDRMFNTLEEAIQAREVILHGGINYAG